MGSYLYCPKCTEYLGSLGGDSCSCGWEEVPFDEPQQRTWVGLTDDQIALIHADYPHPQGFAKAMQAKLKEKNA